MSGSRREGCAFVRGGGGRQEGRVSRPAGQTPQSLPRGRVLVNLGGPDVVLHPWRTLLHQGQMNCVVPCSCGPSSDPAIGCKGRPSWASSPFSHPLLRALGHRGSYHFPFGLILLWDSAFAKSPTIIT